MPRCTFPIAEGATWHVMVVGGIGVTPFLAMAYEFERRGAEWALHVLSRGEPPCAMALAGRAHTGRIQIYDTTKRARPSWYELLGGGPVPGLHSYCCGPQAMLDGFENATATWPIGTTSIEHFVPPPLPAAEGAKPYTLCSSTTRAEVEMEASGSMLAALWELGAKIDASCEGGIYGACEVRWLQGEPIHREGTQICRERRAQGYCWRA